MTEKITETLLYRSDGTRCGGIVLQEWGHVDPVTALAATRKYFEQQAKDAGEAVAALDADAVRVFHQRGTHVARDRSLAYTGTGYVHREGVTEQETS